MKRNSLIGATVASAVFLVGCGDSGSPEGSASSAEGGSTPTTASETTTPGTQMTQPAEPTAAEQAVAEVSQQAQEAVAQVQEKAKAIYEDLSAKLIESTKTETSELVTKISNDLESRVQKFAEALPEMPDTDQLMGKLGDAVQSLLNNQDIEAVNQFNELVASKLTPEQTTLAKDVYNAGAALVTQRNFASLEALDSDVARLSTAVWKGDYTSAVEPLQNIYNKGALSDDQKNLLGAVFDDYLPGWKEKADAISEGVDALKKFGL